MQRFSFVLIGGLLLINSGYALHRVQTGKTPLNFDHLPEIGSGVMEIKVDHAGDTYRTIYIATFEEAVYVLDAFQKKSPTGKKLPRNIRDRLKSRYKDVKRHRPARPQPRE